MISFAPRSCALSFETIEFPLSKLMACETKDIQYVLSDLLKSLILKWEHQMDRGFVEGRLQMIFINCRI